jgi:hypothetical protein
MKRSFDELKSSEIVEIVNAPLAYALCSNQVVTDGDFASAVRKARSILSAFLAAKPSVTTQLDTLTKGLAFVKGALYESGFLIGGAPALVKAALDEYPEGKERDSLGIRIIEAGEWLVYAHVGSYSGLFETWDEAMSAIPMGYKVKEGMAAIPFEVYLSDWNLVPEEDLRAQIWIPLIKL